MAETIADTRRLISKPQNLNDAYGPPSNFLEIDVGNPQTVGVGRGRFTTYEIRVKVRGGRGPARGAAAHPAHPGAARAGGRGRPAGSSGGYVPAPPAAGPGASGANTRGEKANAEPACRCWAVAAGSGRLRRNREGCPRGRPGWR